MCRGSHIDKKCDNIYVFKNLQDLLPGFRGAQRATKYVATSAQQILTQVNFIYRRSTHLGLSKFAGVSIFKGC